MIFKSKICGVSDTKTLNYIVNHKNPPNFVGFIVNYKKSKRYVKNKNLKELLKINKKKSLFVAVLVNQIKIFWMKLKICHLIIIKFMTVMLKKYNI